MFERIWHREGRAGETPSMGGEQDQSGAKKESVMACDES